MSGFVHLHVHSEYSLLDGAARIEELVAETARMGMSALALTDHGVMYGAIPFYKACIKHGIKPILGCEMYYTAGSLKEKAKREDQPIHHLVLLAKNRQGYENLMRLVSIAHLEGFYYKPRIDYEHLRQYADGLICLSGCLSGEIPRHLRAGRYEEAKKAADRFRAAFGDDFYLEVQDHGLLEQKKVMQDLIRLSEETGIPLVATNDVHYVHREDAEVQDVLMCIGTGKTLDDKERLKAETDQLYLKSPEEMATLFAHLPEALANTERIAASCHLQLELGQSILPEFRPIPEGETAASYLAQLCRKGLVERYAGTDKWQDPEFRKNAEDRLAYELGVIERMGYSDYFLIVWDFIRFAHERGIPVGPGRGSSAGSLTAYVLRITDVDPLRYNLLFERFLNPERVSMPDIDIDFSDERREEVIQYVVNKYGSDHVGQIITFGTMAAKAAVRDVGRVMNLPYNEVDKTAKLIPNLLGITLDEALELSPDLKALAASNPQTDRLLRLARKVEGMPRHASTHAAGVVISREPLTRYVPLQEGSDKTVLTQFSMENLEAVGMLKMDFLGLRTLSIIERTQQWIRETTGEAVDLEKVPDDDPKTYELLSRGETTGIFQLESAGFRRVLKEMRPSTFEDIISVLALYRPGPMEFIPRYIQAKHGLVEVEYPHPSLEPILRDTYGIIVYQEQIMQIASKMAGFSLGEADLLRRAVGKKKREVLDEERLHFVRGSLNQGYTGEEANRVYDMIVRFADYGFCRAHATAYAVLAYRTAYLKAHYPVQFMAAMLTAVMGNHRKVAEYVEDCRRMGIQVLPPDINESKALFTPAGNHIRFGLAAIKNVGLHAIDSIIREREEGGPYTDLVDFCRRVDLRTCNKRVIESLIQGGAFDSLPGHRAQLVAMLDEVVEESIKWKKEREDLQLHLFGFTEEANWTVTYPDVRPYAPMHQLELERELLGLYISGHPLDAHEEKLEAIGLDKVHELTELPDGSDAVIAGMVVSSRQIYTKKGQPMAFAELEDRVDRVELVLFPETWKRFGQVVDKGSLLVVKGKLQHQDENEVKVIVDQVASLEDGDIASLAWWKRPIRRYQAGSQTAMVSGGGAVATRIPVRRHAGQAGSDESAIPATAGALPIGQEILDGRENPGDPGPQIVRERSTEQGVQVVQSDDGEQGPPDGHEHPMVQGRQTVRTYLSEQEPSTALELSWERRPQAGRELPAEQRNRIGQELDAGSGKPAGQELATVQDRQAPQEIPMGPGPQSWPEPPMEPGQHTGREQQSGKWQRTQRQQRLFVKVGAGYEQPDRLTKLQALLKAHAGPLETVLYYERERRTIVLSDQYKVKPSPQLIRNIESLFGEGTARVK